MTARKQTPVQRYRRPSSFKREPRYIHMLTPSSSGARITMPLCILGTNLDDISTVGSPRLPSRIHSDSYPSHPLCGRLLRPPMAGEAQPTDPNLPPLLLLLRRPSPLFLSTLSSRFRLLKPWDSPLPLPAFLSAHAASARALLITGLAPLNADSLDCLPALRFVFTTSVGLDHIDLGECERRGVAVADAGTVFTEDVADYAVGLLIDVLRRISAADRFVRQGLSPDTAEYFIGSKLGGKRVGIIGLGSIGSNVAKRLEAFGCTILYNSRTRKPSVSYKFYHDVRELAADSDILITTCSLTSETHHIINRDVMLALGKKGIIINVGRGALINERELIRCLIQGDISGVGLDVFENEPLVPRELITMDNVVLSPHAAVMTLEMEEDLLQLLIANLDAFFSGKPLVTPVSA